MLFTLAGVIIKTKTHLNKSSFYDGQFWYRLPKPKPSSSETSIWKSLSHFPWKVLDSTSSFRIITHRSVNKSVEFLLEIRILKFCTPSHPNRRIIASGSDASFSIHFHERQLDAVRRQPPFGSRSVPFAYFPARSWIGTVQPNWKKNTLASDLQHGKEKITTKYAMRKTYIDGSKLSYCDIGYDSPSAMHLFVKIHCIYRISVLVGAHGKIIHVIFVKCFSHLPRESIFMSDSCTQWTNFFLVPKMEQLHGSARLGRQL